MTNTTNESDVTVGMFADTSSGWACADCAGMIASGTTPADRGASDEVTAAWSARVEFHSRGYRGYASVVSGHEHTSLECGHARACPDDCSCEHRDISTAECGVCRDFHDGERHAVTFVYRLSRDDRRKFIACQKAGLNVAEALSGYLRAVASTVALSVDSDDSGRGPFSETMESLGFDVDAMPYAIEHDARHAILSVVAAAPLAAKIYRHAYSWEAFGADLFASQQSHQAGFRDMRDGAAACGASKRLAKVAGDYGRAKVDLYIDANGRVAA